MTHLVLRLIFMSGLMAFSFNLYGYVREYRLVGFLPELILFLLLILLLILEMKIWELITTFLIIALI